MNDRNYRRLTDARKIEKILERSALREEFYSRLIRFVGVCLKRGLRLIFENPWSMQTYLRANFLKNPSVIDENRRLRGDYFIKPTAYWFWNCDPTFGESYQTPKELKYVYTAKKSGQAGLCSEERSMISPDYARNFICDFIIGKQQFDIDRQLKFEF